MTDLNQNVQEAFEKIHVPEEIKHSTLAYIEAQRPAEPVAPVRQKRRFGLRGVFAAAACLAFALIFAGGWNAIATPTAYIDIDMNPSIELSVNRFNQVCALSALNADGEEVLANADVNLVHMDAEQALDALIASEAFERYTNDSSYLAISVVSEDEAQAAKLEEAGMRALETAPCSGSCHMVDASTWNEAQEAGMGVGRYQAAQELLELDPSLSLEDCSHMSMRELRDRIAELGGSHEAPSGSSHGAGHGQGADHAQGSGHGAGHGQGSCQ